MAKIKFSHKNKSWLRLAAQILFYRSPQPRLEMLFSFPS